MSLNLLESGVATKVAAFDTGPLAEANAPPSMTVTQPTQVALGSLGKPGPNAVANAAGGERLAGLPSLRIRTIVRAGKSSAAGQLTQGGARLPVPELRLPQGSAGGKVLSVLFPPGSVIVRTSASSSPPLQGYQPTGESLAAVEASFTPQRINAFAALGNEQKLLGRSLLADLLPRLQAGTINEAEFDAGVGLVLQAAKNYVPPASITKAPQGSAAVVGNAPQGVPAKKPDALPPVVGQKPQGTQAVSASPAKPASTPTTLPPVRPANFDITKVPTTRVVAALDAFETNGYPVSNPTYKAPADALFETTFKGLNLLGSRSLTMAEWRAVVTAATSGTSEQSYAGAGARAGLQLVVDPAKGMSPHEFHLAAGGFGDVPKATGRTINAGLGREGGLVAHLTDEFNQDAPDNYGDAREIFAFWGKDIARSKSANAYIGAPDWDAATAALKAGSASADVPVLLKSFWGQGYFADPREMTVLRPVIKELLGSAPDSPQRVRAATALVTHLRERTKLTETISVSGATAEIQFAQTLYRYFKENGINPYDPNHKIDFVEVQKLYHRLLDQGALVTRADVTSFLTDQKVPYYP